MICFIEECLGLPLAGFPSIFPSIIDRTHASSLMWYPIHFFPPLTNRCPNHVYIPLRLTLVRSKGFLTPLSNTKFRKLLFFFQSAFRIVRDSAPYNGATHHTIVLINIFSNITAVCFYGEKLFTFWRTLA